MPPRNAQSIRRKRLEEKIRTQLEGALKNADTRRSFICTKDVESIWKSVEDIRTVIPCHQGWTHEQLEDIKKRFILTLSILLRINWLQYHDFRKTFYEYKCDGKGRGDKELHHKKEELDFLEGFQTPFFNEQYIFKPAILKESDNQVVDSRCRLPFTEESLTLGSGGYGIVKKVKIAPDHFETGNGSFNTGEQVFAIKRFSSTNHYREAEFEREVRNVQLLRESLSSHKSVMLHIATIVHGNEYAILMPIADRWDLEIFLNDGFNKDNGTRKSEAVYKLDDQFPRFSGDNKQQSVLWQMYALADALDWLHYRLDVKDRPKLCCAHTDLKPSNILICSANDEVNPAGRWMITDFGISAFQSDNLDADDGKWHEKSRSDNQPDLDDNQNVMTVYDFASKTQTIKIARTQEGTYLAPEARHSGQKHFIGRKSDIWSFGCVLSECIVFALGHSKLLNKFRKLRARSRQLDCFYSEEKLNTDRLQPSMQNWSIAFKPNIEILNFLDNLALSYPSHLKWIAKCTKLIKHTLAMRPEDRPDALRLKDSVRDVFSAARPSRGSTSDAARPSQDLAELLVNTRTETLSQSPTCVPSIVSDEPQTDLPQTPLRRKTTSRIDYDSKDLDKKSSVTQHSSTRDGHQSFSNSPSGPTTEYHSFEDSQVSSIHDKPNTSDPQSPASPAVTSLQTRSPRIFPQNSLHHVDSKLIIPTDLARTLSNGRENRQFDLPERKKIVCRSLDPNGERVAFLYADRIEVFLVSDGSSCASLELDTETEWRQVCICGICLAAYGINRKEKKIFSYNLDDRRYLSAPSYLHISDVWKVIVTSQCLIGFVSERSIVISNTRTSIYVSASIHDGYCIQTAEFSTDGTQLYAWTTGPDSRTPNRYYLWSTTCLEKMEDLSPPMLGNYLAKDESSPKCSLIPSISDTFAIVREEDRSFFVAEPEVSNLNKPRSPLITELENVMSACIYSDRSLICVHKKRTGFSKADAEIREHRIVSDHHGSHRIEATRTVLSSLDASQVDKKTRIVALHGLRACIVCFSSGRAQLVTWDPSKSDA